MYHHLYRLLMVYLMNNIYRRLLQLIISLLYQGKNLIHIDEMKHTLHDLLKKMLIIHHHHDEHQYLNIILFDDI